MKKFGWASNGFAWGAMFIMNITVGFNLKLLLTCLIGSIAYLFFTYFLLDDSKPEKVKK